MAERRKTAEPFEVNIAKDVIVGIANIALESVKGATPVNPPVNVGEVLAGKRQKDISVTRTGSDVTVDVSVNVDYGKVVPEVAKEVQRAVAENIQVMTGLNVKAVNVTVQSIVLPASETANA